jgi:hypothetical protein
MATDDDWVHIGVEKIIKETNKERGAFLVTLSDWEGEFWLPYSCVADYEMYSEGDTDCIMSIKRWLADELGI